jgi:hypothetical protein
VTKAKISEYSATAGDNTDVNGVNIAEGCPPSSMNNMGREIMAALKRYQVGSDGDGVTVGGNFVVSGSTTIANTATLGNVDINGGTIDSTAIGGSTAAAVSATTLNTSGQVVFNDAGADVDFRVEGDTEANLLFVDASADRVGIGTNTPADKVDVKCGAGSVVSRSTSGTNFKAFFDDGRTTFAAVNYDGFITSGAQDMFLTAGFGATQSMIFRTSDTDRMRIDSSGNVGIGTSSPSGVNIFANAKLAVVGAGDITNPGATLTGYTGPSGTGPSPTLAFQRSIGTTDGSMTALSNAGEWRLGQILFRGSDGTNFQSGAAIDSLTNASNYTASNSPASLRFLTTGSSSVSPTERMRITSGGQLAINTTSAVSGNTAAKFVVKGASGFDVGEVQVATNGTLAFDFRNSSGTQAGSITVNASTVAYNVSSDYRLKENVAPMTGALAKVLELNPVTYTWKIDGSAGEGFIAHELQAVCPDAVSGEKDKTETRQVEVSPAIPATYDEDGNELTPAVEAAYEEREVPKYQGVDTSFLVATLTAAIQELSAKNDALEARIAALEGA